MLRPIEYIDVSEAPGKMQKWEIHPPPETTETFHMDYGIWNVMYTGGTWHAMPLKSMPFAALSTPRERMNAVIAAGQVAGPSVRYLAWPSIVNSS